MRTARATYTWPRFAGACLKWAFLRWERGESYGTLLVPNLVTVLNWLLGLGGLLAFSLNQAQLAVGSLAVVVILAAVVAPYYLWREARLHADDALEALEPRLRAEIDLEEISGASMNLHACVLRLANVGGGTIEECQISIRNVKVLISDAWEDTGLDPLRVEWPRNLDPVGASLTFHDEAHARLWTRPTRGSSPLRIMDVNPHTYEHLTVERQIRMSVAEHPRTQMEVLVSARGSIRWAGTVEVCVDPTGARNDEYDPSTGKLRRGEEVSVEVRVLGERSGAGPTCSSNLDGRGSS